LKVYSVRLEISHFVTLDEKLLKELAAQIYQLTMIEKCDFELLNPKAPVNAQIIGYHKLRVPQGDSINPEELRLARVDANTWAFKSKSDDDPELQELMIRLETKPEYMVSKFSLF
jgi:hypothetical protein